MSFMPGSEGYDAIIVGSGAGGGMVAYNLTKAGAKCLLLEAGDWYDTAKDSRWLEWGYDAPHRGAMNESKPVSGAFEAVVGGWKVEGEPYTCAPGTEWKWFRSRMLGGRTNAWGRISLRNGSYDFKPHSRDGKGFDWPIGYEELAPYYDNVEELIGVFGSAEGIENLPDGKYLPPPAPRCYEKLVQKACSSLNIPCIPSRLAVLTRPHQGRPACHYVSQCYRGCRMGSNFSSPPVLLLPAMETGNLEIRCGAMVREVLTGPDGRATGVSYIDKQSGEAVEARARIVVLAASSCETARILLNSRSSRFPNGLANSSGMVGRYLMDTVMSNVTGWFPSMMNMPPHNEDGVGGMHLYMPWWNYEKQKRGELAFSRGYHIEFYGGRSGMPAPGVLSGSERILGGGYGRKLKQQARGLYGSFITLQGRGEMIPNEQSYCEIDRKAVDQWGIPVLRFHFQWGREEIEMARHMQMTFRQIVEAAGGKVVESYGAEENWGISEGGQGIHDVGGARMGSDPKSSVLNPHCQAWDCGNLFVADGAPFVSLADKNPTLTIMALAWRTSDYIVEQMKAKRV
jgi:choline dehydrogenase-like flavoprotein